MAEKKYLPGNTVMMILKLLNDKDMYGHQIIIELSEKSFDAFNIKTGILYPILHDLENDGMVTSYRGDNTKGNKRRYYSITARGKEYLAEKWAEWEAYSKSINNVMTGGLKFATES